MKVKAVVMCLDHQNSVKVLKKKEREAQTFRFKDEVYKLDSDFFQITNQKVAWFWKKHYITFYYRQGSPSPLPVPDFPEYANLGVSSEELGAIFNPWFYRTIGHRESSRSERLQFYATVAAALGVGYLIYLISGMPDQIIQGVVEALQPPTDGTVVP